MSLEAWGTPPEKQEPPQRCPVCDGEWHAEDCELGQEVARRLKAEDEVVRLRQVWEATRTQRDELLAHLTRRDPLPAWAVEWIKVYKA